MNVPPAGNRNQARPFGGGWNERVDRQSGEAREQAALAAASLRRWRAPRVVPLFRDSSELQLVRRGIIDAPGWHYGVRIGDVEVSAERDRVVDFQSTGEIRYLTWPAFRAGRHVDLCRFASVEERPRGIARIRWVLSGNLPYDVWNQNCEHVARWIVTGKATSEQSEVLKACALAAGVLALVKVIEA